MNQADAELREYRAAARRWIEANLEPRTGVTPDILDLDEDLRLQSRLADAGYAGFAFPTEFGGAGLTLEHQIAFFEEAAGYVTPTGFGVSIGMLAPTILDHGSHDLKARYLPAALRGEVRFIQLLSEPSGGSDMASALTGATRDGDTYVLNGAKMWSSGVPNATHGLLLARTDWDVPKHHGLSMFVVPLDVEGMTIEDIVFADGTVRFCQEYLDDVVIPATDIVGDEGNGWRVAQTLLLHERKATVGTGLGFGYMKRGAVPGEGSGRRDVLAQLMALAERRDAASDPGVRRLIGQAVTEVVAHDFARRRIMAGQGAGELSPQWGSLLKLGRGTYSPAVAELTLAIAGQPGVIGTSAGVDGPQGVEWLVSRGPSIGGGTNEMQRNIVSERLLGFPREPDPSRDLPFREVNKRR
jgi:alkylation response protein AidB-like acyl-CoA dehydrogenase